MVTIWMCCWMAAGEHHEGMTGDKTCSNIWDAPGGYELWERQAVWRNAPVVVYPDTDLYCDVAKAAYLGDDDDRACIRDQTGRHTVRRERGGLLRGS